MLVDVELLMTNYIAHPYWPARNLCIDIEKKSGINRQKSDEKRKAALEAECQKRGMTMADYHAAQVQAAEPWYRSNGSESAIVIPRHQIAGAIVQVISSAPKALRGGFDRDNFRALVQISDFVTERTGSDGKFERFVKLEGSNQRSWQVNDFLGEYLDNGEPFLAKGTVAAGDAKALETVKMLFDKAVGEVGIGASRKMGFGRGIVSSWKARK